MATTADIKNGVVINFNNDLCQVVEFLHVKPGKGGAFVRTKLKSISSGKVIEHTFNAGSQIETARVERRPCQYIYCEDNIYYFMDNRSFDQTSLEKNKINADVDLLKEGQEVEILFNAEDEMPISCNLPPFVTLEVTYTEPGIKGDTATNTLKSATLETGAVVKIPLFIEQKEKIKIDTRTGEYVERVK